MKLLIAEDDPVFQLVLHKTVVRWGYRPTLVADGEAAWRELSAPSGPRLALLDWNMPKVNGLEVCRRIRAANFDHYTYLIVLTSRVGSPDLIAGLEAGADDYLTKPVSTNELKLRLLTGCRILQSEERRLAKAQSTVEFGQLARGIAEEITTPIHFIDGNAGFLEAAFRDLMALVNADNINNSVQPDAKNAPATSACARSVLDIDCLREEIPRAFGNIHQNIDHIDRLIRSVRELTRAEQVDHVATEESISRSVQYGLTFGTRRTDAPLME